MESLESRTRMVTVLLVLIIVLSIFSIASVWSLIALLNEVSSGAIPDLAQAEGIDARQRFLGIAQIATAIACVILFLMWFYRAHKNLGSAGLQHLDHTPGWAVGGFFVPFLNLVRPFQVMKEVWKGSAYLSAPSESEAWSLIEHSPLVTWWWALFLTTSILGNISTRLGLEAHELDEILRATYVVLIANVIQIPAAIIAIRLVRRITELQEQARTRIETEGITLPSEATENTDGELGSAENA